uniref:Autophagy protein 16 n=1 Tax=Ganoderma boninense TaxID=34458 RepID=A0A5K1K4Y7_9APHY|nr:Autophagy protein 16 [Ganoderma boninense]
MPHVSSLVRRDGLSSSTIITIAVVAASVVILAFALFAWRFFARQFRRSRVPLPPVQDLAHHREHQAVSFADRSARPTTWVDPLSQKPRIYSSHFLSVSGSSASLIRNSPDFTPSRGPTRENSWIVEDATSSESSPLPTPLMANDLLPPNPSFLPGKKNLLGSMNSVASTSDDGISEAHGYPALGVPTSPSDATHSAESSMSSPLPPARPRPPRQSRSRTRPMSIISSSGTVNSIHSVANTLRGPAHSIHSSVQIVLPAPLAPQLYSPPEELVEGVPRTVRRSASLYSSTGDRKSVVDQWVMVGSRSQTFASASFYPVVVTQSLILLLSFPVSFYRYSWTETETKFQRFPEQLVHHQHTGWKTSASLSVPVCSPPRPTPPLPFVRPFACLVVFGSGCAAIRICVSASPTAPQPIQVHASAPASSPLHQPYSLCGFTYIQRGTTARPTARECTAA